MISTRLQTKSIYRTLSVSRQCECGAKNISLWCSLVSDQFTNAAFCFIKRCFCSFSACVFSYFSERVMTINEDLLGAK